MKTITSTCDSCGKDLTDKYYESQWRIEFYREDIAMLRPYDNLNFCDVECVCVWVRKMKTS